MKKIVLVFFLVVLSCKESANKPAKPKKELELTNIKKDTSFNAFLEFPLKYKKEVELNFKNLSFGRQYKVLRNKYSDSITYSKDFDTLVSYSSEKGDTIQIFKNRYTKKVTLLNLSLKGFSFSNGGYIGMNLSDFTEIFNLKLTRKDSVIIYEDEFTSVRFEFKDGKLKKVLYENVMF